MVQSRWLLKNKGKTLKIMSKFDNKVMVKFI